MHLLSEFAAIISFHHKNILVVARAMVQRNQSQHSSMVQISHGMMGRLLIAEQLVSQCMPLKCALPPASASTEHT
jgi:hypothetical protein